MSGLKTQKSPFLLLFLLVGTAGVSFLGYKSFVHNRCLAGCELQTTSCVARLGAPPSVLPPVVTPPPPPVDGTASESAPPAPRVPTAAEVYDREMKRCASIGDTCLGACKLF
jgi:hypothetical protein